MELRQKRTDRLLVVVLPDHSEQAAAVRLLFPDLAHVFLLGGVGPAPEVRAFVLDDERSTVGELADEVGIELARGGLEPESVFSVLGEVAHPVRDFGLPIEEEGAVGLPVVELADGVVVVLGKLVVAVVQRPVRVVLVEG